MFSANCSIFFGGKWYHRIALVEDYVLIRESCDRYYQKEDTIAIFDLTNRWYGVASDKSTVITAVVWKLARRKADWAFLHWISTSLLRQDGNSPAPWVTQKDDTPCFLNFSWLYFLIAMMASAKCVSSYMSSRNPFRISMTRAGWVSKIIARTLQPRTCISGCSSMSQGKVSVLDSSKVTPKSSVSQCQGILLRIPKFSDSWNWWECTSTKEDLLIEVSYLG